MTLPLRVPERELWVPTHRLQPILDRYTGKRHHLTPNTQRRVNLVMAGSQQFVSLSVVDRILIEMGLDEWLRLDEDQGGLADIYQDGRQYGAPFSPPPAPRKHSTEAERREAERLKKQRWRDRCRSGKVVLGCAGCGGVRVVGAKYAASNAGRLCVSCGNSGQVAA